MGGRTLTIERLLAALILTASTALAGCVVEAGDLGDEEVGVAQDELAELGTDFELYGEAEEERGEGEGEPGEEEQSGDNPKGGPEPTPWRRSTDSDDSNPDDALYITSSTNTHAKDD